MQTRLRREYVGLLTNGGQLLLLVALHLREPLVWRICLTLIAVVSLLAWLSVMRRARALSDTPTSAVASAAQGYVELCGRGKPLDGLPVIAPLTNLPCLWYRYRVQRRSGNKWVDDSSGESDASFLIDDGSGICVVDPVSAEILPARCDRWRKGDYRYTQWLILSREWVYVIGGFRTEVAAQFDYTVAEEVRDLLAEWKQDQLTLLKRFDLDANSSISLQEWELARAQARREVERRRADVRPHNNDLHWMGRPEGDRLYLISTLDQSVLIRRFRLWAWIHVAIFFAALIALTSGCSRAGRLRAGQCRLLRTDFDADSVAIAIPDHILSRISATISSERRRAVWS